MKEKSKAENKNYKIDDSSIGYCLSVQSDLLNFLALVILDVKVRLFRLNF